MSDGRRVWQRIRTGGTRVVPRRRRTRVLAVLAVLVLAAAIAVPFGLSGGRWAGPVPRPPTMHQLTPVEAATRGGYVALGDSYSSGEGAYTGPSGGAESGAQRCHRSPRAYYTAVAGTFRFAGGVDQLACAGATVAGVRGGQYGLPSQLNGLKPGTSLVTISVGGNDAGFSDVLTNCIVKVPWSADCRGQNSAVTARLPGIQRNVTGLLNEINRRSPAARIILVGYPRLFPASPTATEDTIGATDQRWLNAVARRLDTHLRAAARAVDARIDRANGAGTAEYVNAYDAFTGHEIGTTTPYLNGLDVDVRHLKARPKSFHPNPTGYRQMARLVTAQIRRGPGRPIHQYVLDPAR